MCVLKRLLAPIGLTTLVLVGILLLAACGGSGKATTRRSTASPTPVPTSADIKMIPTTKFDKATLTIAANKDVTITVDNTDTNQTHNFAVYKSKAEADAGQQALAKTSVCKGPCKETVGLKLAPGEYFFRCDVHPTQMTGKLVVQ